MRKYSEIVGLPVFSSGSGKKMSNVTDIVFSKKKKAITGLIAGNKAIPQSDKGIAFEDVVSMGRDAIMVKEDLVFKKVDKDFLRDRLNLIGLKVYTREGTNIGIVGDVLFDAETGNVEGVEMSDGLLNDIISGRNILPFFGNIEFNDECMFVGKEAYEELLHDGGGLKNLLGNSSKTAT